MEITILQIIGLGYIINIFVLIIITLIYTIESIINFKNPKYMSEFLEVKNLINEIQKIQIKLKEKNISYRTQYDFIFLIPYSGILNIFLYVLSLLSFNTNYFMYNKLLKIKQILEDRDIIV